MFGLETVSHKLINMNVDSSKILKELTSRCVIRDTTSKIIMAKAKTLEIAQLEGERIIGHDGITMALEKNSKE